VNGFLNVPQSKSFEKIAEDFGIKVFENISLKNPLDDRRLGKSDGASMTEDLSGIG
jgi:hypothetical protein